MIDSPSLSPWTELPDIAGANVYRYLPAGAVVVPAIVYRPDQPWIERRQSYKAWVENYVAVCLVVESSGADGVEQLYRMALAIKEAIDSDPTMSKWEWKETGGVVGAEQGGARYLGCAVRLSFRATY